MRVLRTPVRGDHLENAQQVRSRVRRAQQNEKLFKKLRLSKLQQTKRNAKSKPNRSAILYLGLGSARRRTSKEWKLLPPGITPFTKILKAAIEATKKGHNNIYDVDRLTRIYELRPTETWIGERGLQGYVAFVFDRYRSSVLECPLMNTNNATYVLGENWKSLIGLTKSELLNTRRGELERIIHGEGWFLRLTKLLADRKRSEKARSSLP